MCNHFPPCLFFLSGFSFLVSFGFSSSAHHLGVSVSLRCKIWVASHLHKRNLAYKSVSHCLQVDDVPKYMPAPASSSEAPDCFSACLLNTSFQLTHRHFKLIMTHIETLTTAPFQTLLLRNWSQVPPPRYIGCQALSEPPPNISLLCLLFHGHIWRSADSRLTTWMPASVHTTPRVKPSVWLCYACLIL